MGFLFEKHLVGIAPSDIRVLNIGKHDFYQLVIGIPNIQFKINI